MTGSTRTGKTGRKKAHATCGARLPARRDAHSGQKKRRRFAADWMFVPEIGWRRVDTVRVPSLLL